MIAKARKKRRTFSESSSKTTPLTAEAKRILVELDELSIIPIVRFGNKTRAIMDTEVLPLRPILSLRDHGYVCISTKYVTINSTGRAVAAQLKKSGTGQNTNG